MGVYIKDMEMPKDCIVCPFGWNGCNKQHDFVYMGSRSDNCPLVPVPPHGRLIDADALCKTLRTLSDNEYTPEVFANWIENYIDTIIPAEEGE